MRHPLTIFIPHCSNLLTDYLPHGDGLIAHGFISQLARRGHCIHVVVQEVDLREPLGPNVTIHHIPGAASGHLIWRIAYMRRLRRLFWQLKGKIRFDLIHQLNPVFTGLSLALAGSRLPLVLGTYVPRWPFDSNPDVPENWMGRTLARGRDAISSLQQCQADALVLTSPAAQMRLPNPDRVRDRVHFLPHGIDTELFSPGDDRLLEEASQGNQGRSSILFLANVVKRKGIFTLIDAFPAVAHKFPGIRLRVAGDGPDLAEVKRRVAGLGYADQVEFLGRQERTQTPPLYRNCSIYCLPSFGEPYGTTLVEAMSCGKPVVVTDSGGPPHLVSSQGGKCIPAGDAESLANALLELLRDPKRRAAMGQHNRRVVEATMSWDSVTRKLESIYEIALKRGREAGQAANKLPVTVDSAN